MFESNGPEVRVRGTVNQVLEKYLALARDASSAGDYVSAENYFQHAEHYYRILGANGGNQSAQQQGGQHQGGQQQGGQQQGGQQQGGQHQGSQHQGSQHQGSQHQGGQRQGGQHQGGPQQGGPQRFRGPEGSQGRPQGEGGHHTAQAGGGNGSGVAGGMMDDEEDNPGSPNDTAASG